MGTKNSRGLNKEAKDESESAQAWYQAHQRREKERKERLLDAAKDD